MILKWKVVINRVNLKRTSFYSCIIYFELYSNKQTSVKSGTIQGL